LERGEGYFVEKGPVNEEMNSGRKKGGKLKNKLTKRNWGRTGRKRETMRWCWADTWGKKYNGVNTGRERGKN
jgi:hypothetical protein